jgi:hypothetical protein
MTKPSIPKVLSVSPLSLTCPYCGAKPNDDCMTAAGGFAALHLVRIEAAAQQDALTKKG